MIVLDTNVIVRIMKGEGRIGEETKRLLDRTERRYASAMVHWELAMLSDKGRMGFDMPIAAWMARAADMLRFVEVPVSGDIARDAGSLRGPIHGDPCDRIMIATARMTGYPLLTTDRKIIEYGEIGHVQAIDARR